MTNDKVLGGAYFFRLKTEFTREEENGSLSKVKVEELVLASNYTEAETVAYGIIADQNRTQYGDAKIEIIKTKICDFIYNNVLAKDEHTVCGMICNFFEEPENSGVGLYSVKVIFLTVDEKTGKTKKTNETFFVPATSNSDATSRVKNYLNKTMMADYVIRDTRFDKAEAIYWPKDVHQKMVHNVDLDKNV